ncbi:MAG: Rrf2 family transcriptional regulator [Bacteroidetes bacterium]|nr:Rrf2 family transcriptional regulator [Bacteroidota bacterium]
MRHIATKQQGDLLTAKEIADTNKIPYELLAKVLQRLSKAGLIISVHGVHGGYSLAGNPSETPLWLIISAIEGTHPVIAQCLSDGPESCDVFEACTIRTPLTKVQSNIERAFSTMMLSEII